MNQTPDAPPQANVAAPTLATQTAVEGVGVSFDELPNRDRWRFAWGFVWRSLCIAVLSMLGGAVAGAIIGFVTVVIAQALGKSLADVTPLIRILSATAGLLIGFVLLWQLIRWYFRANWFGHRLRLVKNVA